MNQAAAISRPITMRGIEEAVNKSIAAKKSGDRSLSPPATALAEIYGWMIHEKKTEIDFAALLEQGVFGEAHSQAIQEFYPGEAG